MRIAQITYSYRPITGGADVWTHLLREVCEGAGYDVTVYQRPVELDPDDPAVRMVRSALSRLLGRRGEFWTLPLGLPAIREELAEQDVLVVHYPNYHRLVEWHPRTVLISHGVLWDDRPRALRSRIKRSLARRAYRTATAVVANDTFFLREVGEPVEPGAEPFCEVAPRRFFIPNCVDVERFAPGEPHPDLAGQQVILVPRNLYWNRGVHLAIEAFAECAAELPEALLVVVGGEGQPGYRDHCERVADRTGVAARVRFQGAVAWEQMPGIYRAAALTVIPTLCGEGTSLSALESMACGTATITTNVAGLADLPAAKSEPIAGALAQAIREAWERRAALAEEQQARVRAVYNLDNWRRAWLRVLDGLGGD
jgi:glycosyltransferase involved in cell wall biosynthesis